MSNLTAIAQAKVSRDVYTDLNSVQAINAIEDKNLALKKVAQQFESMMLRSMLKSMRDANKVFSEGNYLSSHETDTYRDMLDDQLAVTLSGGRGMGIAEVLTRQLQGQFGSPSAAAKTTDTALSDYLQGRLSDEPQMPAVQRAGDKPGATVMSMLPSAPGFDGSVEKFVDHLYPLAKKAAAVLGVDPRALLAQSALETGWGRKVSQSHSGESSFNFFNIKADHRWQGDAVSVSTLEHRDGMPVRERASFRAYDSAQHSFDDYVDFLMGSARYEKAMQCSDSESFIKALAEAGYATDEQYADKILTIMKDARLNAAVESAAAQPAVKH